MIIHLGKRRLHLAWRVMLPAMILPALMLSAAVWQWGRAQQKIQTAAARQQAEQTEPRAISILSLQPQDLHMQAIQISGHYEPGKQFLLDNRVYHENTRRRVGYHVITPFRLSTGELLLVERGWVDMGADREHLPQLKLSDSGTSIAGIFMLPEKPFRLGAIDADARWPRVIQYIDFSQLQQRIQQPLYTGLLILNRGQPGALLYNWHTGQDGPNKHYSYAIQWLLMAIALIVILFISGLKRESENR